MQKIPLDTNPAINLNFSLHLSEIESILGLVQISHGMAEHKQRYEEFINFLNINGLQSNFLMLLTFLYRIKHQWSC